MSGDANCFTKTAKQIEATTLMSKHPFTMLVGGSRSGKTFIKVRNTLVRAVSKKSRHLEIRRTFKSVKRSIWNDTLPKVLSICFPSWKEGVHYRFNKTDLFLELRNGSQYWLGGMDDKERIDRILGTEYSTIGLNEASELTYDQRETLLTRLAENSGLPLKMWDDCNPPSTNHWVYKLFIEGIDPVDGKELSSDQKAKYSLIFMNPEDNKENLRPEYFGILKGLSSKKRKRFLDGLFSDDTEGALWSGDLINLAQLKSEDMEPWMTNAPYTVVAVDPNVAEDKKQGQKFTADEVGIMVLSKNSAARNSDGEAVVVADYSGELGASEWVKKVVWAYQYHGANAVVAEVNNGGELVKMVLRAEDKSIPVVKVRASSGKHTRAEPIVSIYEQGKIKHFQNLDKVESEMEEWVPGISKFSPNRLDALVWGATHLFLSIGACGESSSIINVRDQF